MSVLNPYLFKVTASDGKITRYTFKDFLIEVLGIEPSKSYLVAYCNDLFTVAHATLNTARDRKGVRVELELDPDWEEVFVFEKSKPKCIYTFTTFEAFEKIIAEDCGVKLYITTAGEELNRQIDLFNKDHTNFGAVLGMKSLIGVVHGRGPDHKVYVALADGSNPDQEDTCEVLFDDGMRETMFLLERVASRAGCSVRRDVRLKPLTKVEVNIHTGDFNFLRSRSLDVRQVAQNAVDIAIQNLKGEKK